jgi:hypothetical protein
VGQTTPSYEYLNGIIPPALLKRTIIFQCKDNQSVPILPYMLIHSELIMMLVNSQGKTDELSNNQEGHIIFRENDPPYDKTTIETYISVSVKKQIRSNNFSAETPHILEHLLSYFSLQDFMQDDSFKDTLLEICSEKLRGYPIDKLRTMSPQNIIELLSTFEQYKAQLTELDPHDIQQLLSLITQYKDSDVSNDKISELIHTFKEYTIPLDIQTKIDALNDENGTLLLNSQSLTTPQLIKTLAQIYRQGKTRFITELWLGNNQLSGPIPAELGNLTNLIALGLRNNHLSGPIPAELGALTNLTKLSLNINQLTGHIPAALIAQIEARGGILLIDPKNNPRIHSES